MKAYPAYRDSSLEWIERLPSHWQTKRLKHLSSLQFSNVDKHTLEGEIPIRLCNYTDVYYNRVITDQIPFMQGTVTPSEAAKFALRSDDVLVTKDSEMWNDIAVPSFVASDLPGVVCGYHLAQIRPKTQRIRGKYLAYAFRASGIREQFHIAANGITRYGLGQQSLADGIFPLPPLSEQDAIVSVLEAKEAEIHKFIGNQQRQIELLKAYKAALINRAPEAFLLGHLSSRQGWPVFQEFRITGL
jgi:type I restriction enzyme S subunit